MVDVGGDEGVVRAGDGEIAERDAGLRDGDAVRARPG